MNTKSHKRVELSCGCIAKRRGWRSPVLQVILMAMAAISVAAETPDLKAAAERNYLKAATKFAECMILHGRDRYGEVHSPLFAVLLTRDDPPEMGPHPIFDDPPEYEWQKEVKSPFRNFNYNRCLNYPSGLGGEGPHKITLYGCDVYQDQALYEMLIDLTRITGKPTYKVEAEKALNWWFQNTLGPADLYPWGEHLGWDFEHECPTYFKGPSKHLYAACYHEIKDRVPFLDVLGALPASASDEKTPLEKYALGVWNAHYWDKERAIYCRHGDYTGEDNREGSPSGFPAHQGAHLRLWLKTYVTSNEPNIKRQMLEILTKVLDVQIARAEKHGFIPFTFDPELHRIAPRKSDQSNRLARHASELSTRFREQAPGVSAQLEKLATLVSERTVRDGDGSTRPRASIAKLKGQENSEKHAKEITKRVGWFIRYNDPAYLRAAERQASIAYGMFCDEMCPLPKAYPGMVRKTASGQQFPDFYFRGAKLMHSFALLGEALGQTASLSHSNGGFPPRNQTVEQDAAADADKPRR